MAEQKPPVTVSIDGCEVTVPAGTNLIEAAKELGIEIPHYCYHPCLSVVGNCRMCQVEVVGQPKLMIACHTVAQSGMQIKTHHTSETVRAAQAATLEFILINHPLDCTVCDQSGHCKLQDYHFAYSGQASRFAEEKEHKIKAEPLGPNVILDGERCIMCTRCIRFCDEITKTSELGMLRRGDQSVIAVSPEKPLDNPLSGTVVDLCPVGALTHRRWRFNTRIWFTRQTDSICPGCSTGCNCRVAVRDGRVVQVKARFHAGVNKEWMCDEGRYGFERFLPEHRILAPRLAGEDSDWETALAEIDKLRNKVTLVLLAGDLMLEEYALIKRYLDRHIKNCHVALAYGARELSPVAAILVSPDYAANFKGAERVGLIGRDPEKQYRDCLAKLKNKVYQGLLVIGQPALPDHELSEALLEGVRRCEVTAGLLTDADSRLAAALGLVLPARSVLEKSGLMVNRLGRLQYHERVVDFPAGSEPEWRIVNRLAERAGGRLIEAADDRQLTLAYLKSEPALSAVTIKEIKAGGLDEERWG